jgi:inosine-uridine nucleoside N-ribohydrolase
MTEKVLLDVDPGCDDAIMIAMALAAPSVEVIGLTTVAGNSTVDNTTRNALEILALAGRPDISVARGCERPIVGELTTAEWVHGEDGLRGELPSAQTEPVDQTAPEFIAQATWDHGEDLTIVAVGPLTNIAIALMLDPTIPERINALYVMGGAADTTGNVTPVAEANFYNDPYAAHRVVNDASPFIIGLDVTMQATVRPAYVDDLGASVVGDILAEWFAYPSKVTQETAKGQGPSIHDAAVIAQLTDDVLTFESCTAQVDTSGGPSHGSLIADRRGWITDEPNSSVAVNIDTEAFQSAMEENLDRFIASVTENP